jgi:spore germination protein KA
LFQNKQPDVAPVSRDLRTNEQLLHQIFENCDDVYFRHFQIGNSNREAILLFISNLVDKELLDLSILKELLSGQKTRRTISMETINKHLLSTSLVQSVRTIPQVVESVTAGDIVLLVDKEDTALCIGLLSFEHRSIEKSENEVSIRGPQHAFNENMMSNIAAVRRFIASAELKVEKHIIGRVTKTPYCLVYHNSLADPKMVREVKKRIYNLNIDKVIDSSYLEEQIRDSPWSPFPTVNYTEKPDRVASQLLEGKIAIFVENSPNILTVPALFVEFLHVPEDYYQNFIFQSAIRILRYVSFFISLFLPSLFVAIVAYHHELIPASLLTSMMSQRQGVPLPTVIEVIAMEITFEVLREAGLRLPRPVGQAVSIVGALVIGDAAVQAALVMPSTVIVVATTGIASFTTPGYSMSIAIRFLRFPVLICTGVLGLLGFTLGILIIAFHLVTLKSFGVLYTGGFAPRYLADIEDSILRLPGQQTKAKTPWVGKNDANRRRPKGQSGYE